MLGAETGALLDLEKPVPGVASGKLRRELSALGQVRGPASKVSLAVTCGWGHKHKDQCIVMPGRGVCRERKYSEQELASIKEGAADAGLSAGKILGLWGKRTLDVYLNNETFWSNVPETVWHYAIGGYQVLKKWLSYREQTVLGRDLTKDEVREFTHIVRRVAALILLEPRLNENYQAVTTAAYPWPSD
jgi:hypothetical protein